MEHLKRTGRRYRKKVSYGGSVDHIDIRILPPEVEVAKGFGNVILEVIYEPLGVGSGIDNFGFDPPRECPAGNFLFLFQLKYQR